MIFSKRYPVRVKKTFIILFITLFLLLAIETLAFFILQSENSQRPFMISSLGLKRNYGSQDDLRFSYYDFMSDWAHNPKKIKVPKGWIFDEGYFVNKITGTGKDAKKILIYGGSTTDLAYLQDNWPFYLDLALKKKGLDVKIYVGAVAGMGSSQEFLRMIRDIEDITPDLVISYSGVNEVNTTPLHHPLLTRFNRRLIENRILTRDSPLLPNSIFLIQRIFLNPSLIQGAFWGRKGHKSRGENWARHMNWMKLIAESEGAGFIGFLQPNLISGKKNKTKNELKSMTSDPYPDSYPSFYTEATAITENSSYLESLVGIFDSQSKELYIDHCHLNPEGNELVAEKITGLILEKKLL